MFTKIILRLTHRLWNIQITRILCELYYRGVINSIQLYVITSEFDPTQDHKVY